MVIRGKSPPRGPVVDLGQTWELRICLMDPKVKGLSRARNGPSSVPAYSSTVASEKTHGLKISYKALSLYCMNSQYWTSIKEQFQWNTETVLPYMPVTMGNSNRIKGQM